jgi:DNA helicase II / ATP-dependent DNA helicase PcrA
MRITELIGDVPAAQGYLALHTERGNREYLLGPRTDADATPPLLDWRMAPLAEAFFRAGPGEPFELEVGERVTSGTVTARYVIAQHGKTLIGDMTVLRAEDDWREHATARPAPAPGPPIDRAALPVLDPEQQKAVELPADTSLVVDGEAGVGKTLVALYRIAALAERAAAKSKRFRALVLVPTEGLRRLCRLIADRLGLTKLEIAVFEPWLVARAQLAFPGLPKRLSEGAGAQVIALKRHPALRTVLDDFIGWKPPKDDEKLPRSRARLLHLFGDRDRLVRVLDAAGGVLPERAIAMTQKHTRIQFETTTEKAHKHVDAARLVALDGRSLDAGTPTEDAHTCDFEDLAVLFELVRRKALPAVELPHYDHVFIDEAQLRSALELAAVGDALTRGGTVTLAGDHRQATDESAWFTDWPTARAELRAQRWAEVTLAITYRSVPAIGDFARAVSEARAELPTEPPADPALWATSCDSALAQAAALCWHLDALLTRDPWRQIAVIARNPDHARRLHAELSRGVDPTLVLDGDFRFEPGIIVTTASAVSGLEFDAVVVPDLSASFYPSEELRRALYVVATRARDWLWLLTPERWSPLVQQ